ncbi:hypothetical protein RB595_010206 [Gaeumannomyces hyphopodioides]
MLVALASEPLRVPRSTYHLLAVREPAMAGDVTGLGDDVQESAISILAVTSILLMIRISVRQRREGLGWDDVCIVFSWICLVGFATVITCAARLGFGQHIEEVAPEHLSAILLYIMASSVIWSLGVCAAKASFACFYLRLISDRRWVLVNRLIIVCLLCQGVEQCLYEILQCKPIHKAWTPGVEGTCISLLPLWWVGFALNLGLDLILFIEPIPIVWGLQLIPVTKKIGIIFMLSLGILICGIAIIRIVEANKTGPDVTLLYVPWLNRMLGLATKAGDGDSHQHPRGPGDAGTEVRENRHRRKQQRQYQSRRRHRNSRHQKWYSDGSSNSTSRFLSRHLHGLNPFSTIDRTTASGTVVAATDNEHGTDLESGAGGGVGCGEAAISGGQQQRRPSDAQYCPASTAAVPSRLGLTSHISSAGRQQSSDTGPHDPAAQQDPGGTTASLSTPASGSGGDGAATATATATVMVTTTSVARMCGGGAAGQSQILVTLEIGHDVEEVREQNRPDQQALVARHGFIVPEGWASTSLPAGTATSSRSASPAKRLRIGDGGRR